MSKNPYETPDIVSGAKCEEHIDDIEDIDGMYEDPDVLHETQNYVKLDPKLAQAKAMEKLDKFENVSLNIAVTGESGVGKSSFVNALRGLVDGDEGAADTGVTETTMKAIRYSHPTMPNVYIWDLPGIGTPNFKAKKYLKEVEFDTYDFFLIIGSNRFKENDIMLAKEIKKMKKMFYFIRSKIDQDLQAEARKKTFNEESVLSKIRQSCKEKLMVVGDPDVFLISVFELQKYDFHRLVESLEENLPDHKQSALIQSLPICSLAMIEKKKKYLYESAGAVAAGAAGAAIIAGTLMGGGIQMRCEIYIMQKYLQMARMSFGLDEKCIQRLAERINKPEYELKSLMKSRFAMGVDPMVVKSMFYTKSMFAAKIVEFLLTGIPGLGTVPAMGLAFATTLKLLRLGIREMAEDSKAVTEAAGLLNMAS